MSINLLDLAKGYLTQEVVGKAASFIGEDQATTQKGLDAILPSLLGGLAGKADDRSAVSDLFNVVSKPEFGGGLLNNVGDLFSNSDTSSSALNLGGSLLNNFFGNKSNGILDVVTSVAGLKSGSASTLTKLALPIVMSVIGKKVKTDGLGLDGFMNLMKGQQDVVKTAAPAGLFDKLGSLGLGGLGAVGAAGAAAAGLGKNIAGNVTGAAGNVAGSVKGAAANVTGAAGNVAGNVKGAAANVTGSVKGAAGNVAGSVKGAAGNVAGSVKGAAGNIKPELPKGKKGGFGKFLPILLLVGALLAGLAFMKGCKKDGIKGGLEGVKGGVENVTGKAGDLGKGAVDGVKKVGETAVDGVKEAGETVAKVGEDLGDAFYTGGKDLVGKTAKGFENLGAFMSKKLKNGTELIIPSKGGEAQLINFIESNKEVNKEDWFNLRRVLFQTGSAKLDAKADSQIKNVAEILKAYPNVNIKLGGYTDNTGNAESNLKLSDARAKAVVAKLVEFGISADRLAAEGYGIEHPVATNDTAEGRQLNRRVAARVTKK